MATLIERCKLPNGKDAFVRAAPFAPDPIVILATDFQLKETQKCCSNHQNSCILSNDRTFNLGKFYVTPVHPVDRDSGRHPGPMLIHKCMTFQIYHFFASQSIGFCPDLNPLKAFRTDGELALEEAFSAVFPSAIHL